MREILFRGKNKTTGEWVQGDLFHYGEQAFIAANNRNAEILPETLGQFTGLTDRNGVKIFEWDIISAHLDDEFPGNETRLVVVWHECGFYGLNICEIVCIDGEFSCFENNLYDSDVLEEYFLKKFEVIGNVCDNPELLKGE